MTNGKQAWASHLGGAKKPNVDESSNPVEAQDICLVEAPSVQSTIDLFPSWTSQLPPHLGVTTGIAGLFHDKRVDWALKILGGVRDKRVVEMGPLEGGHTYMLELSGATEIVSIEANKLCFLKCLVAKELLRMKNSHFLLGDFTQWLDRNILKFDVAWVAGVLYHMDDPTRLLKQIGKTADQVYIWTHYVPDEGYSDDEPWTKTIIRTEKRDCDGVLVDHYIKSYLEMGQNSIYCGGVYKTASWIGRQDILDALKRAGYEKITTDSDMRSHPNGPCFHLVASR